MLLPFYIYGEQTFLIKKKRTNVLFDNSETITFFVLFFLFIYLTSSQTYIIMEGKNWSEFEEYKCKLENRCNTFFC